MAIIGIYFRFFEFLMKCLDEYHQFFGLFFG
nr:MAG TPA: hypothetical protein [Caudoviricetes sp.]